MTGMFMGTPGLPRARGDRGQGQRRRPLTCTPGARRWPSRRPAGRRSAPGRSRRSSTGSCTASPDLDTLPPRCSRWCSRALSRDPAQPPVGRADRRQIAAIDPAALVPSPPARGAAGSAARWPAPGDGAQACRDEPGVAWPAAEPHQAAGPAAGPGDLRELLPPVNYAAPGSTGVAGAAVRRPAAVPGAGGGLGGGGFAGGGFASGDGLAGGSGYGTTSGSGTPNGLAAGDRLGGAAGADGFGIGTGGAWRPAAAQRPPVPAGRPAPAGAISAWSPLVIAMVAMAVASAVLAPIVGTVIALAVLVALRAASTTGRQMARRRSDGRRASDPVVATALYPAGRAAVAARAACCSPRWRCSASAWPWPRRSSRCPRTRSGSPRRSAPARWSRSSASGQAPRAAGRPWPGSSARCARTPADWPSPMSACWRSRCGRC